MIFNFRRGKPLDTGFKPDSDNRDSYHQDLVVGNSLYATPPSAGWNGGSCESWFLCLISRHLSLPVLSPRRRFPGTVTGEHFKDAQGD